jgi:diguanylate cyclase (GGDEF)-like protein/PAS domain S-box-containing protein
MRMARLVESADQAEELVTIVDRRGRIEYVNRAVEETTGYAKAELIGSRALRWFPWHAEDQAVEPMRTRLVAGGSFRGTVICRSKDGKPFLLQEHVAPMQGRRSAQRFLSTARDVTSQHEMEARLSTLARFDTLTGLPNRAHFAELLRNELTLRGAAERLDVLILDLDRFRYINDVFTADLGDDVLRRVSEILRSVVGPAGIVGRIGGDEFGVIHRRDAHVPDATALARAILQVLAQNTVVAGQDVATSASIGVASRPADGNDAQTLLKNAHIALSVAKSKGRNTVQPFSPEMSSLQVERHAIQRHVAGALRKSEYLVEYQPYYELSNRRMSGAEALIRWTHQELGLVPPSKFIPALEESGQMIEVGEWVLRTACDQIRKWTRGHRALPVAVNLSQIQFGHRDLVGLVADAVKQSEINPRHLTLELTESICVHDIDYAADLLGRLKRVGVAISVDDFGTGYSSLSYVKKLPVDNLKIDMSFVRDVTRDPDAASIITAITSMARGLGLKTIAEGVETPEQANVLHLLRCDMAQGYHFGRAMAPDAFEKSIDATPGS